MLYFQHLFHHIVLLSIYQLGGWGRFGPSVQDRVFGGRDEFDHIEDQMEARHGKRELELVGVFSHSALDDVWAEVTMTEFSRGAHCTNV